MANEMQEMFQALLSDLFTNEQNATQATTDWGTYVEDNGYQGLDMTQVDMSEAVYNVSNDLNIAPETQVAMLQDAPVYSGAPASAPAGSPQASVTSGGASGGAGTANAAASGGSTAAASASSPAAAAAASSGGSPAADYVPANVNHYLTQIYEDNSVIQEYDNSTHVNLDGEFHDDVEIDTTTVVASGEGAVAAGDDIGAAATGDGAFANDGHIDGDVQNVSGDGAVAVDGGSSGPIVTGDTSGVIADGNITDSNIATEGSTINDQDTTATGGGTAQGGVGNTNTNADGGDAVVGSSNVATGEGNANFGAGDQVNVENSDIGSNNSGGGEGDGGNQTFNFGSGTAATNDSDTDIDASQDNDVTTTLTDQSITDASSNDVTVQTEIQDTDNIINESFNDESIDQQQEVDQSIELEEVEIVGSDDDLLDIE